MRAVSENTKPPNGSLIKTTRWSHLRSYVCLFVNYPITRDGFGSNQASLSEHFLVKNGGQSNCYCVVTMIECFDKPSCFHNTVVICLISLYHFINYKARDQTKINCFFPFLVVFIFSCRSPLPVVSPLCFFFLRLYLFLGFAYAILPILMC